MTGGRATRSGMSPPAGPDVEGHACLPGWVLRCWTRSWRDSYGDEMADTWADGDGTRRGLVRLAATGLQQRVMRPRTAAGHPDDGSHAVDAAALTTGSDLALAAGPRMMLRTLTAVATLLVVMGVEVLLVVALDVAPGPWPSHWSRRHTANDSLDVGSPGTRASAWSSEPSQ